MEINFPNLINTALPDRGDNTRNRNAIILSSNSGPNHNEQGFLSSSFPRDTHKLFITADADDGEFDESTLRAWRAEGFEVRYVPLGEDESEESYRSTLGSLRHVAHLGPCEQFGIVAFGKAAGIALEYFHHMANNPEYKLACLIAYYPTRMPDPRAVFPGGLRVLVHLAGNEVGVVSHSQIVGIQGKRKVSRRSIETGGGSVGGGAVSVGGVAPAYPCYWYEAAPGFAEGDLDEFEKVPAEVAWSRSLDAVRTAFRMDVVLEGVVEQNLQGKFFTRNLPQTISTYTTQKPPHVTYFPTLSGGIGTQELQQFYADYFLSTNPESTKLTLLSRTIGADRIVDELHVSFKHTQEIPWILPGVPPTGKRVEVAVVSIVTIRGGKIYAEHVYWDQASVLVQVGLLDPKLVPEKMKGKGVAKLPVVGREAARRLVRGFEDEDVGEGEADNELLPGWYDDDGGGDGDEDESGRGKGKEVVKGETKSKSGVGNGVEKEKEKQAVKENQDGKEREGSEHAQKTNGEERGKQFVNETNKSQNGNVEEKNEKGGDVETRRVNGKEEERQTENESGKSQGGKEGEEHTENGSERSSNSKAGEEQTENEPDELQEDDEEQNEQEIKEDAKEDTEESVEKDDSKDTEPSMKEATINGDGHNAQREDTE
ncbi:hypothetical protein F5Y03DRAFT_397590 [Xylaria venustula]|nr:hypothetical protein F5Y03DRAFT_397590 [Xylaria venustula]